MAYPFRRGGLDDSNELGVFGFRDGPFFVRGTEVKRKSVAKSVTFFSSDLCLV